MKILFTKTGIENEVSQKLGTDAVCDFQDFITVEQSKIKPFFLKNYSLIFSSVNAVKSFFNNGFKINRIIKKLPKLKIRIIKIKFSNTYIKNSNENIFQKNYFCTQLSTLKYLVFYCV
jgi:uroporphyrinogen-III synthase